MYCLKNDSSGVVPPVRKVCNLKIPSQNSPENSPNQGVSIPSSVPSPPDDEISSCSTSHTGLALLFPPTWTGIYFTPWSADTVAYRNTVQRFHPSLKGICWDENTTGPLVLKQHVHFQMY